MMTTTKLNNIDKIIAMFIINNPPEISKDTDYKYLNDMIQVLYMKISILLKIMKGGKDSHVLLIVKDTLYSTLTARTPWPNPIYQGMVPIIDTNGTVVHHFQANNKHGEQLQT